jgi:F0F1-type ATP synthase epsilon subunit
MAEAETPATPVSEDQALAAVIDDEKPSINIKVYAPFKVYYEGIGYSISAVNETGPFDILPHHHNFLCMLVPCNLKIQTPDGEKVIKINRALMHVKGDRVVVFVDV